MKIAGIAYVSYSSKIHPRKLTASMRQCVGVKPAYQAHWALLPADDQLPRPLRTALDALETQILKIHEDAGEKRRSLNARLRWTHMMDTRGRRLSDDSLAVRAPQGIR